MKQSLSILLLLAICWQITGRLHTILLFNLNQETIAKTLCENKNQPSKKCHGKCVLTKAIKTENEREQKQSSVSKEQNEILACGQTEEQELFLSSMQLSYPPLHSFPAEGYLVTLIHPPSHS